MLIGFFFVFFWFTKIRLYNFCEKKIIVKIYVKFGEIIILVIYIVKYNNYVEVPFGFQYVYLILKVIF